MTAETTMWPFLLLRHLHVCLQQHSFRKPRHREKNHRSFGFPGNLQHFHWPSCPRCCLCHGWPIRGRATNVTVEQPKVAMEDSNCSGAIENRSGFPTVVPSLQGNGNASPRMASGKMRLPAQRWWKKQNTTCFLMVLVKLARLSATIKPPHVWWTSDKSNLFGDLVVQQRHCPHALSHAAAFSETQFLTYWTPPWPRHHSIWKIAVSFNG